MLLQEMRDAITTIRENFVNIPGPILFTLHAAIRSMTCSVEKFEKGLDKFLISVPDMTQ